MSNEVSLFPPGVTINEIHAVVDELADAAFKKHGLAEAVGGWLLASAEIAEEVLSRKSMAPLAQQAYEPFIATMNVISFRLAATILALDHLTELNELAQYAAEQALLPTEDEYYAQLRPVEH